MASPRRPSKAEKSLFLTCGIILVPLAALVFFYSGRDAEPNWNIPPAAPRPNPNGYDFYVAAAKAKVRFTPPVDPILDTTLSPLNSPYALKNYSLARRQNWLKANARTFALVNKGLATPSLSPDDTGMPSPSGDWSRLRELARAMTIRTHTFQMQNLPMRATMSALDTMQMGQDSTRGGNLIARLVGIAIVSIGRDPLEDWNKTINALSADEARTAARRLELLLAHEPTATQTMIVEKRDKLLELRRTLNTKDWRGSWNPEEIMDGIHEAPSRVWQRQTTSKQTVYDNMNGVLDKDIASSKLPYSKAKVPTSFSNLDVFNWYLTSNNRYFMIESRNTTSNNMLLLRLALRAYIAEHKAAPPTLAALVPGYLKTISTDLYNDGKPLFYVPNGKTYKLWSVGPDGINNGGVPLSRTSKDEAGRPTKNRLDNTGDFVAGLCR